MNADEVIKQMQADDLEGAQKLTPVEYGRLRKKNPQNIYYHIRAGHITVETCICGRKVIDVAKVDEYFDPKPKEEDDGS